MPLAPCWGIGKGALESSPESGARQNGLDADAELIELHALGVNGELLCLGVLVALILEILEEPGNGFLHGLSLAGSFRIQSPEADFIVGHEDPVGSRTSHLFVAVPWEPLVPAPVSSTLATVSSPLGGVNQPRAGTGAAGEAREVKRRHDR